MQRGCACIFEAVHSAGPQYVSNFNGLCYQLHSPLSIRASEKSQCAIATYYRLSAITQDGCTFSLMSFLNNRVSPGEMPISEWLLVHVNACMHAIWQIR